MSGLQDLEYQLKQAMNGTAHVFLIDEPSIVDEMGGFSSFYRGFCESTSGIFLEFRGSELAEQILLKRLNLALTRMSAGPVVPANTESNAEYNYRSVHELMDRHRQGLISIRASHTLSKQAIKIIRDLVDYARQNRLGWKVFLVADSLAMDNSVLTQLTVDQSIPDKSIEPNANPNNSTRGKHKKRPSRKRSRNALPTHLEAILKQGWSTTSAKVLLGLFVLTIVLAFYLTGL